MNEWLKKGALALESGQWAAARDAFNEALAQGETAEALDGLARSLWWLGETKEALYLRERAFNQFRDDDPRRAARIALWLAGEYEAANNLAASSGWRARAERLLEDSPGPEHGWLALAEAGPRAEPAIAEKQARDALSLARLHGDSDLEVRSLARIGLILIASGRVEEGIKLVDEAMASATAGESCDLETVGETCCDLLSAVEVLGDFQRFAQWNEVVMTFMQRNGYGPLVAFCGTCCAEVFTAGGNIEGAEAELTKALRTLQETGQSFRCAHPAAKLAELRILQGRFEEAERLLSAYSDHPATERGRIDLSIANGEYELAMSLLQRVLDRLPRLTLLSVPYLSRLVRVAAQLGNLRIAQDAVEQLHEIVSASQDPRAEAEAHLAEARFAAPEQRSDARRLVDEAITRFDGLKLTLDAARARMLLAEIVASSEPALAALEARAALRSLESSGADREADQAAALLRTLEGSGRSGPKRYSGLTKRELEVLDLLGEGLNNAEIGERLFISTKTAGHHVSNVLMKLHLRSRTEAAVYAVREAAARIS